MIVIRGEFTIGILGNGFIGFTNCIAWIRNQKLCLLDFILTSLAFARINLLWLSIVNLFSVLVNQEIRDTMEGNHVLSSMLILANHLSTWFAVCLAVFYFPKIANFSYALFLWLKWRTNKVVFMLLLVSVPFLLISFPLPYHFDVFWYHVPSKYERTMTRLFSVSKNKNLNYIIMFMIGCFPPFSISLISFLLLLLSLWRHTKHIEINIRKSGDVCMESHFRAMKTAFLFLEFFALYHVPFFLTFWGHFLLQKKLVVMLGYMLGNLYPSGHSNVVIFGNSQMRKAFLRIPLHLKHGLKGKAPSAT